MHLRTVVGVMELSLWQGQDPQDKHWGCPMRERWGWVAHQQMRPALEEKLAFTATLAGSYADAALLAQKWGCVGDDSVIHALVQCSGEQAEAQIRQRLKDVPPERYRQRRASVLAVLMRDGWHARFRGPGWGKKKTQRARVEWHEVQTGVFYLHEPAARTEGERGVLAEKTMLRWQGEPLELGQRLHWEGLRGGMGRAKDKLVLGEGSAWIGNVADDRWSGAHELLDFYHGSEHLWGLGRALCKDDQVQTQGWVEPRLHELRHGQEQTVLKGLAALRVPRGPCR